MNSTAWKWILAANCLIASSASFAGAHTAGLQHSLGDARHQPQSIPLDPSKFQYMDSAPIYNTHHVRAAVMVYERRMPDKQSQCTALKGEAKHRCYELAMPT